MATSKNIPDMKALRATALLDSLADGAAQRS